MARRWRGLRLRPELVATDSHSTVRNSRTSAKETPNGEDSATSFELSANCRRQREERERERSLLFRVGREPSPSAGRQTGGSPAETLVEFPAAPFASPFSPVLPLRGATASAVFLLRSPRFFLVPSPFSENVGFTSKSNITRATESGNSAVG